MSTSEPRTTGARTVRVLIADPDRRVRAALAHLLTVAGGFEVSTANGDVAQALRLAAERRPDVGIVNLLLSDAETGLKLVTSLHGSGVPVVAMSAYGGLRSAALASGATSFLQKDGVPEVMLDAVRRAATTSAAARPDSLTTP